MLIKHIITSNGVYACRIIQILDILVEIKIYICEILNID